MLGIDAPELLVIIVIAVIVIGPKDLPVALRTAGRWIGKMRRMSSHFRTGIDAMVREAELEDMEKKWKAQNEKVMRQYPQGGPIEVDQTGAYPPAMLQKPAAEAAVPVQAAPAEPVAAATAEPVPAPADVSLAKS